MPLFFGEIFVRPDADDPARFNGTGVAMRGLFADVDDGERVWPCTIRRIVRSRRLAVAKPLTEDERKRLKAILSQGGE